MKIIIIAIILGLTHGIADASTGFILGNFTQELDLLQVSNYIILYNLCGFGLQAWFGQFIDQYNLEKLAHLLGLILIALSIYLNYSLAHSYFFIIILAGLGSAFFHIGAGAIAIKISPNNTIITGLFTAPGVLGLAIGITCGINKLSVNLPLISLLISFGLIGFLIKVNQPNFFLRERAKEHIEDNLIIKILVIAISLTSTLWTSFQFLLQDNLSLIIFMAISAMLGKIIGGIMAQIWNKKRWIIYANSCAFLCLLQGENNLITLLLGLSLLQSNIPITLTSMSNLLPKKTATAVGLCLGLSILLGGIPIILGYSELMIKPLITCLIFILICSLMIISLAQEQRNKIIKIIDN